MKIAISGSGGFIGTHILKAFSDDAENDIRLLKWRGDRWELSTEDGKTAPILSSSEIDVDVVILLGASMPKDRSEVNDFTSAVSNINSSSEFTKLPFLRSLRILFFSTIDVYSFDNLVSESTDPQPASLYGHAKLFCEMLLREFAEQNGHELSVLRVGHVFGPGENEATKVVPRMLKDSKDLGVIRVFGEGDERRSFLFVRDLVSMVQELIHQREIPSLINLVGSESRSIAELAKLVASISRNETKIIRTRAAERPTDQEFDKALMHKVFSKPQTSLAQGLREELDSL